MTTGLSRPNGRVRAQARGPADERRPRTLWGHLRKLYTYRELIRSLALREVRTRYKQSVLGIGWTVLQPVMTMLIFTAIFSRVLRVGSEGVPYPIFSYVALVPWTLFSASLIGGAPSIINNMGLVGKIYFPREIFPLSVIGACSVDFVVASSIVGVMLIWYQVSLAWTILLLPLLVVLQTMLTVGLLFVVSSASVFIRDIRFVVPLMTQMWMYLTPIAYPISEVPERYLSLYKLNPMVGIIDGYRRVVVHGRLPDFGTLAVTAAVSVVLLIGGYALFKRLEMRFADII